MCREWTIRATLPFVGPGVANTFASAMDMVKMMSFWTFDDVFEEGGRGANSI